MADIKNSISGASKGAAIGNMLLPGVGGVVGGVAGFLGGLFGGNKKSPEEQAAEDYMQELIKIGVPPKEALQATYTRLQSQGVLTPEMEQAFTQADSKLNDIEADPALKEAQMRALESLRRTGEEQGLTLEDRVAMTEAKIASDTAAKGRNDAIMQNMAARGMGGAGSEIALRAMNEQAAANTNALRSAQIASEARKRAIDSVLKGGTLAGTMAAQEFSEAARKAEAQDAINKFNTSNRQGVETRNVLARNDAALKNLEEKQRIADANVNLTNKEADNAVSALKTQRGMQLDMAQDKLDARTGVSKASNAAKAKSATSFANTLGGIEDAVDTVSGILKKNKAAKEEQDATAMRTWKDG